MPRYDQHFLVSAEAADRIVRAACVSPGESVLEIGPGRGALTRCLLEAGARLSVVEIDPRLAGELAKRWAERKELRVVQGDFLRMDLSALGEPRKVVGNLPYSVATPILQRLLDWPAWKAAVLMFQKEVARRILAGPGEDGYSLLSLSVLVKAQAELVCGVPRSAFRPMPKVDSAVVRLDRLRRPRLPEDVPERAFFAAARAAFAHRRKLAAKSIALATGAERGRIEAAFVQAGIPACARAEDIPPEWFIELARRLK
ncbi:MAG: ribosomal RNA small subunit methyltransferase A [Elusimicrobia bacterium]|nr:ribosomal RNA small subunit methyltransferase A [Elusimicrobiota bacterium]